MLIMIVRSLKGLKEIVFKYRLFLGEVKGKTKLKILLWFFTEAYNTKILDLRPLIIFPI